MKSSRVRRCFVAFAIESTGDVRTTTLMESGHLPERAIHFSKACVATEKGRRRKREIEDQSSGVRSARSRHCLHTRHKSIGAALVEGSTKFALRGMACQKIRPRTSGGSRWIGLGRDLSSEALEDGGAMATDPFKTPVIHPADPFQSFSSYLRLTDVCCTKGEQLLDDVEVGRERLCGMLVEYGMRRSVFGLSPSARESETQRPCPSAQYARTRYPIFTQFMSQLIIFDLSNVYVLGLSRRRF